MARDMCSAGLVCYSMWVQWFHGDKRNRASVVYGGILFIG